MATYELPDIKTATRAQEQQLIDTLVLAFSSDPVIRWFYPNPHDYLRSFPDLVRSYGGKAFDQETAYYIQDFSAASLWLPPEVTPDEEAMVAMFENTLSEERQEQAWSVLEQLNSYHPSKPCWHLPLLGVDPTRQRQGAGSALLKHTLKRCDEEDTLAYLESSNPENISLYVRHGFKILGSIHGETMPPLIPMLREPQT